MTSNNDIRMLPQEDFSDYVAHLQVHMSLQARHLLPQIREKNDHRSSLLYKTQVMTEKYASRQFISSN